MIYVLPDITYQYICSPSQRRKKVATFEIGKQIMSIDVSGDLLFAGLKTGAVLVINIDMNVKVRMIVQL